MQACTQRSDWVRRLVTYVIASHNVGKHDTHKPLSPEKLSSTLVAGSSRNVMM